LGTATTTTAAVVKPISAGTETATDVTVEAAVDAAVITWITKVY
jgi:hypothetical protein